MVKKRLKPTLEWGSSLSFQGNINRCANLCKNIGISWWEMTIFLNISKHILKLPSRNPNHWRIVWYTVTIPLKLKPKVGQEVLNHVTNAASVDTFTQHGMLSSIMVVFTVLNSWQHANPLEWFMSCCVVVMLSMWGRPRDHFSRPCLSCVQKKDGDTHKPSYGSLPWLRLLQNAFLYFGAYSPQLKRRRLWQDIVTARGSLDPCLICFKEP